MLGPYKIAVGQYPSPAFWGLILPIIPFSLSGNTTSVILQFAETNIAIQPEYWRLRIDPEGAWVKGTAQKQGISLQL